MSCANMIEDLDEAVKSAVLKVFRTMLDLEMAASPITQLTGERHIAGSVGFVGRLSGVVYLQTTEAFARRITATLLRLGMPDEVAPEMLNDTVGELANMVVGQLKSHLSDNGLGCVLTIPSVVRGRQLTVESVSQTQGSVYGFQCNGDRIVVEFLVKLPEATAN